MFCGTWVCLLLLFWMRAEVGEPTGSKQQSNTCAEPESLGGASVEQLRFAIIADLDKKTNGNKHWFETFLKIGALKRIPINDNGDGEASPQLQFEVVWEREIPVKARHSYKNRGLELSDLALWRGSLWSICDSTGILYELVPDVPSGTVACSQSASPTNCSKLLETGGVHLIPRLLLTDDGGNSILPAKNEWIAVVNNQLHIGGHGREWVVDGTVMGRGGEWVKIVSVIEDPHDPGVESLVLSYRDWKHPYRSMRRALRASYPGYVSHESAEWWSSQSKWVFFPRKISEHGPYSDDTDEMMGNTNRFLLSSHNFSHIEVRHTNHPKEDSYGVSAIRAVPGFDGIFLILRVIEQGDTAATELDIISLVTGHSLLSATSKTEINGRRAAHVHIGQQAEHAKFEGIEFLQ